MKLATVPSSRELPDYPEAIAAAQRALLQTESHIIQLQETLAVLGVEIEKRVLADVNLSNDAKRKAKRLDLQQSDPDYSKAAMQLKAAQEGKAEQEIQLGQLLNHFSVLKLNLRFKIAQMALETVTAA
jgi:hypothetical protein